MKLVSSISTRTRPICRRSASGAKTSSDSRAIFFCFSGGSAPRVRKLCRRSANLIIRTRISCPVAISSFRRLSPVCGKYSSRSFMPERALLSLVTPLTRKATSLPNCSSISLSVRGVSSTVSCKIPAMIVSSSIFHSSSIFLTASG